FPAYTPVDSKDVQVAWGGKQLMAPARTNSSRSSDENGATRAMMATAGSALAPSRIQQTHMASVSPAVLPSHPVLWAPTVIAPKRTYGIRTQGHTDRIDVSVPCNKFGMLYVQTQGNGATRQPIGCQDAYALGHAAVKLFEPLAVDFDGKPGPFTVYRSLQVPGRFLVLPAAYTIGRFEPGDSRAYRPALFLFSNIDAVNRDRTRCVVMATLQPAVSPYWRRRLTDYLAANIHGSPELQWPTELATSP